MTYPPLHAVEKSNAWLSAAVAMLKEAGIEVPKVSSGNSPDMWTPAAAPVTERRPGTYIYYDRFHAEQQVASLDDCALTVLATVVSRPTATRAVIDAGSKSLASSDLLGLVGHGLIMGTELTVKALSEEHGVIEMPAASDWPRVGERLRIIPNHACVVSNLFTPSASCVSGEEVQKTLPVAARGQLD